MATNETQEPLVPNSSNQAEVKEQKLSRRKIIGWTVPVVAMVMTPRNVFAEASPEPPTYDNQVMCKSWGYYKNCDLSNWPVKSFTFNGKTYTATQVQNILKYSKVNDPYFKVLRQVVASYLNNAHIVNSADPAVYNNEPKYIQFTRSLGQCEEFLNTYYQQPSWSKTALQNLFLQYESDYKVLDSFNQEQLCW